MICSWQFFKKIWIIFDSYFQLKLFSEVSLIFVENAVDSTFSYKFYIL